MSLVATTRRLDHDVDLLAVAGPDGFVFERSRSGLAARGVALRCPGEEADEALGGIEADDEVRLPGSGPVGFAALPFRPGDPWELVVPATTWGRSEDGTRWVTTVSEQPRPDAVPPGEARDLRGASPGSLLIEPARPAAEWCALVDRATSHLASATPGGLEKVVLARELRVTADVELDSWSILRRLRAAYPGCHLFRVGGFLGASPELLVSRSGDVVRAQPMAGTASRGGDPVTDARLAAGLLASATYRHEHQLTIDMVHDTLLPWCSYLDYEAEPSVVGVANVQHLATLVEGRLSQPPPSVLELVRALHPTPAVAGWPPDQALAWIEAHEGLERGRYAGAVGWVDAAGNGTFAVSIRCAEVDGRNARLWAGNGIVAGSDPEAELAETQAKFQAMLGAIVRV